MSVKLRFGSICSGMEAASLAWTPLGWECAFVAEIEKAPSALLAARFPHVPNYGDVTKFADWPDHAIDLLVGGTPCQSFSVAGLRKGLADPRGSLMLVFGAIAARYRPAWFLWENVPGVLSDDDGRSFASFLGLLSGQRIEPPATGWQSAGVITPGTPDAYGLTWRRLDAQYFGLAQRRARVFVVGYLGDWRPPAAVLLEPESLRGDSPPRREARESVAGTIAGGARGSGGYSLDDIPLAETLRHHPRPSSNGMGATVAYALNAKGGSGRCDAESETFIAHTLKGEGFDASEDGTGRGTPIIPVSEPFTLAIRGRGDTHNLEYRQDGLANAVLTPNGGRGGIGVGAIAFSSKDHGADAADDLAPTLRAMGHDGSHANAGGQLAVAFNITPSNSNKDYNARISDRAQSVTTQSGMAPSARGGDVILEQWAVRRLTEKECERLQGAPDDHTLVTYRGKPMAGGPRYKMIGNSFAVNTVRWIGERIGLVASTLHPESETP